MASLKRRYQETTFEGDLNPPPRFRPPGGRYAQLPTVPSTTTTKFTTADAVKAFEDGVEYVVIQRIRGAKLQNRQTMAELLKELRNSTRVLNDVFKHGARLNNLKQNQIQSKIRENRAVLQSDYIKKNFWRLVDDLKDEDPKKPQPRQKSTRVTQEEDYRVATTTFDSIARTDGITEEMKQHIRQRITAATEDVSNHVIDFGVTVLRYMTMFKTHTFQMDGDNINFVASQGQLTMEDMLPEGYIDRQNPPPPLPPHLNANVVNNDLFQQHARGFMTEAYLERIYTTYLGSGMTDNMLNRYPLHRAILTQLPPPGNAPPITFSALKQIARKTYEINFDNLWKLPRRFSKVFNKLISVLLKVHLAPVREAKYQEYIKQKQGKRDTEENATEDPMVTEEHSFAGKTRNHIRRIFLQEKKNKATYDEKARLYGGHWIKKAKQSSERLNTFSFVRQLEIRSRVATQATTTADEITEEQLEDLAESNPVASSQLDEKQDLQNVTNGDLSARAIRELGAAVRNVIFTYHGRRDPVTEQQFQNAENQVQGTQLQVCLNIVNQLLPYVPSRITWNSKLHQLPFILLANDVFRATGYNKFAVKLCNLPSTSSLIPIQLNATSIYNTFCAQHQDERPLDLFTYDNSVINDDLTARSNTEATINSIFNLQKIETIMEHYQMKFEHRILLLPGFKTVRLTGTKLKTTPSGTALVAPPSSPTGETKKKKKEMTDAEKEDLENEIAAQKAKVDGLVLQLKGEGQKLNEFLPHYYEDIKELKNLFPTNMVRKKTRRNEEEEPDTEEEEPKGQPADQDDTVNVAYKHSLDQLRGIYHQLIDDLKAEKNGYQQNIARFKQQIQQERYQLHVLRSTKSKGTPPTQTALPSANRRITEANYKCYEKAEKVRLDEALHHSQDVCYAGTDNGIVTTTETTRFNIDRFKFHLKLANRFGPLSSIHDDDSAPMDIDDDNDAAQHDGKDNGTQEKELKEDLKADPSLLTIPKAHKVYAKDIDFLTGAKRQRTKLQKAKRATQGQTVVQAERILSENDLHNASNLQQINARYLAQLQQRHVVRSFYNTATMHSSKRRYEFNKNKQIDRICARERQYVQQCNSQQKKKDTTLKGIIFVGDRGTGVGSRIKGHLRYGGFWKPRKHSLYTSVCVTNEHNTSQTCGFCFQKTTHPVVIQNEKLKTINGTSVCVNPECLLVKNGRSHQRRDSLSALLIGLSGLCNIVSGTTFPALNPNRSIGHSYTDFTTFASSFPNKKQA